MPTVDGLIKGILKRFGPRIVAYLSHSDRQKLVDRVMGVALQSRGYNNYMSHDESGEAHLVRSLKRIDALGTCLDVGANQGSFAELMLGAGAGNVFAFEPHPVHRESLERLSICFPGKLSVIEAAVGATSGRADLLFNEFALSHASLAPEANEISYVNNGDSIPVRLTSIDDAVTELRLSSVDFLKIDTEGFEHEVLTGSTTLLKCQPPKAVLIEFNQHQLVRGHSLLSLSRHLPGYSCFQLLRGDSGVRVAEPHTPEANIFHFSNFVFVRQDVAQDFIDSSRSIAGGT